MNNNCEQFHAFSPQFFTLKYPVSNLIRAGIYELAESYLKRRSAKWWGKVVSPRKVIIAVNAK